MGQLNQMIMSPMALSIIRNSFSCSSHMNSCLEHSVVSRGEKKKWVLTNVSHPVLQNKTTFLTYKHKSVQWFNLVVKLSEWLIVDRQVERFMRPLLASISASKSNQSTQWICTSVFFASIDFRGSLWHWVVWDVMLLFACFYFNFFSGGMAFCSCTWQNTRLRSCFSSLSLIVQFPF